MTLLVEQQRSRKVRGLIRAERAGTEQKTQQRAPVPGMLAATRWPIAGARSGAPSPEGSQQGGRAGGAGAEDLLGTSTVWEARGASPPGPAFFFLPSRISLNSFKPDYEPQQSL